MKSLKKCLIKRKYRVVEPLKEKELINYLEGKLRRFRKTKEGYRIRDRRPKELKILHVAKAVDMTYDQVRRRLDKYRESGIIEKFVKWTPRNDKYIQINYYRFTDW